MSINGNIPPAERFELQHIPEPMSGCWLWTGALSCGYGVIGVNGRSMRAHRWSYERDKGPIPPELEIDHLCRVKCCVNPDHLEAVTHSVNISRTDSPAKGRAFQLAKTHCPQGHPYSGDNLYVYKNIRGCRACRDAAILKYRTKKRNALIAKEEGE